VSPLGRPRTRSRAPPDQLEPTWGCHSQSGSAAVRRAQAVQTSALREGPARRPGSGLEPCIREGPERRGRTSDEPTPALRGHPLGLPGYGCAGPTPLRSPRRSPTASVSPSSLTRNPRANTRCPNETPAPPQYVLIRQRRSLTAILGPCQPSRSRKRWPAFISRLGGASTASAMAQKNHSAPLRTPDFPRMPWQPKVRALRAGLLHKHLPNY